MEPVYRPAQQKDARAIAQLVDMASEGVALVEWAEEAEQGGDASPHAVGERLYAKPPEECEGDYGYHNCVVAVLDGAVIGMLLTFAMPAREGAARAPPPPYEAWDVFAPFKYLEAPDTWYVCSVAVYPAHRGQGIGSRLMDIARRQAREHGFAQMSLVAFEENEDALRLYRRLGFRVVDRAPIVPHPLIRAGGDALLMVADARVP